jgi:type IV pilus assembly protein PilQ
MRSIGVSKRYKFAFLVVCASATLILGCSNSIKNSKPETSNSGMSKTNTLHNKKVEEATNKNVSSTEIESAKLDTDKEEEIELAEAENFVTSMNFIEAGAEITNSVKAIMSGPVSYKLEKTAPSEYVLRLYRSSYASDTKSDSNSLMSSNPDSLIRSIRVVQDREDLLLRIFAKPESALKVTPDSDDNLIIESMLLDPEADSEIATGAADDVDLEEIKAQADPSKAVATKIDEKSPPSPIVEEPLAEAASDPSVLSEDQIEQFLNEGPKYTGRKISLDLQEADIDNALRIIAEVSNLNIIASEEVAGKITLRLTDVPWDQALDVILKTNGLDKVQDGNVVRIAKVESLRSEREALKEARQAEQELEPLRVKYIRVSYARASELQPLIENVVSERGVVAFDERTNQIIVRDIQEGLKNVVQLVSKLDLRTPQVLLETQILEANRSLNRDLGSQFGFSYVQSPQTGNGTGSNFPNSVQFGGSLQNPAGDASNAISLLLGSADGTRTISQIVSALENEGTARVVSRPAVSTTNNKPATIRSTEKVRIRLPTGGVSVATGQGAQAAGQGNQATEVIEIGIVLEVTPQASPDYYVLLDINAKSSTLGNITVDGIPTEIERSARSSVLVSSGQTFALGGIYKTQEKSDIRGLPFFKDIPVLGTMFRRLTSDSKDEELIFFITPRIIEGSFDDAVMKSSI